MNKGDKVRIANTNTAFDGKEGILEEIIENENNTMCTVYVDFIPDEGKKVRQNFDIGNIEFLTESKKLGESKMSNEGLKAKLNDGTYKYDIYQLKNTRETEYGWMSYDFALEHGFSLDDYQLTYTGSIQVKPDEEVWMVLEDIFEILNIRHPSDYKGHSLSVSDIVGLDGKLYYVDSIGFKEIDNEVKECKMTEAMEDDSDSKIKKLAEYLEIPEEDIKKSEYDDNIYSVNNGEEEYIVCDEETAYDLAVEDIKQIYDDLGLESFTPNFQNWIIENAIDENFLRDATYDDYSEYVDEMDLKYLTDMCIDKGIISEDDCEYDEDGEVVGLKNIDEDELRQKLLDEMFDSIDDYADHWISMLGKEEFSEWIKNSGANLDLDKVAEECIKWDGVAHFISTYDGQEIDLGDYIYAYRIN